MIVVDGLRFEAGRLLAGALLTVIVLLGLLVTFYVREWIKKLL